MEKKDPQSVSEVVEMLLQELPLKDRTIIANMSASELPLLDDTIGDYIRNRYDLIDPDSPLMKSCRFSSGRLQLSEREASGIILRELAYQLHQTHRLRIV